MFGLSYSNNKSDGSTLIDRLIEVVVYEINGRGVEVKPSDTFQSVASGLTKSENEEKECAIIYHLMGIWQLIVLFN